MKVYDETSMRVVPYVDIIGEYVISMIGLGDDVLACSTEKKLIFVKEG